MQVRMRACIFLLKNVIVKSFLGGKIYGIISILLIHNDIMEGDEQYGKPRRKGRAAPKPANRQDAPPTADGLRRKEKFNSLLIITIGFLTLVFGLGSMFYGLANPFADILAKSAAEQAKLAAAEKAKEEAAMKLDTDGDGLTDYDEANKYSTNPYLKDSNGDGIDDKTSLARGIDPNCAEGQICFSGNAAAGSTSSASVGQLQTTPSISASPTISASYIRSLLVANGATDDQLSGVSDAELVSQFRAYLKENPAIASTLKAQGMDVDSFQVASSGTAATSSISLKINPQSIDISSLNIRSAEDLKSLSGAQIRQLMISAGASSAVLSAVSDEELKQIFIKQLEAKAK